eukprot:tig00000903_g5536.t1
MTALFSPAGYRIAGNLVAGVQPHIAAALLYLQAAEAASCDARVADSPKVLAYGHAQRAQNLKRRVELFVEAERRVRAAPPPRAGRGADVTVLSGIRVEDPQFVLSASVSVTMPSAAADEELLIEWADPRWRRPRRRRLKRRRGRGGRPVSGTVRSGAWGRPGLRVEASDGRQVAVAPAVAARFGLGTGRGDGRLLRADGAGGRQRGDGEGGPSAEPNLYLIDVGTARGHAARPVHGLVADTPGGLRLVLQVYGYVHGPPAGAIVVPESTASSYSLKAGDYIRGLAGPDEAPADPSAPEGSKQPARKRFALRAVYHVEQGAR